MTTAICPHTTDRLSTRLMIVTAIALMAVMLLVNASTATASDPGPKTVRNGATPQNGISHIELTEQWRRGDEDDDLFFGLISAVETDGEGNLYLLDSQLSTIYVLDSQGEFLRQIGHEGEGPGEFRRARSLIQHADGNMGVIQRFPGSIVNLTTDGIPAGVILPGDPVTGGRDMLAGARIAPDGLVLCGAHMTRTDNGRLRRNFLSLYGVDGIVRIEYFGQDDDFDFGDNHFNEANQFWIGDGLWDVLPDGRVVTGRTRDDYSITMFETDGTPSLTFSREAESPKRSPEELDRLETRWKSNRRFQRFGTEQVFDPANPMLNLVRSRDGEIWVLPSDGQRGQPDGILQTWDIFLENGTWDRQVAVRGPGDGLRDRVFFLGHQRVLIVAGFQDALDAIDGVSSDDDDAESDAAPIEVILYQIN